MPAFRMALHQLYPAFKYYFLLDDKKETAGLAFGFRIFFAVIAQILCAAE
jgi:hypothetical protein